MSGSTTREGMCRSRPVTKLSECAASRPMIRRLIMNSAALGLCVTNDAGLLMRSSVRLA